MKTVNEVSKLTGVSVRTLHYYDSIGLLKPTKVSDSGYRLYDNNALGKLQTILLFRELQFPLKDIKAITESPNFDLEKALKQQISLLELKRKQLEDLITLAHEIISTGGNNMNFSAFDKSEIEKYTEEVKSLWGKTDAYKEYEKKSATKSKEENDAVTEEFFGLFAEIGKLKQLPADSREAQDAVEKLRLFITENYYNCTPQILSGLGQMYSADERFKANIDKMGGEGTAEFISKAIAIYCKN